MAEIIYDNCEDEIIDPVCDPCIEDVELGSIRSVAFVHKSIAASILANPADANTWAQGIFDKKIYVIPETQGSYDGGAPVEGRGYGDRTTRLIGYTHSLTYRDPVLKANQNFYRTIKNSGSYHLAFRTETQTRLTGKPVTVFPKAPVADDQNAETVWENDVRWAERDQPVIFDTPEGIFTCEPVTPVPVPTITFKYGSGAVPTDLAGINAGQSATASHNAKLVVPDFGNETDDFLWMAEPLGEPTKTRWYNTVTNQGSICSDCLFLLPVVVSGYRIYASSYETSFNSPTAVEFRTS